MNLILILLGVIAFIVLTTTKFKLHPFLALIIAAFFAAFAYGLPADSIAKTIASGFGGILGYIGLVIVLGTIIGVILEKSGAAITMADTVIKVLGERFPTLTMSIIGYIVSVPVFCDSGFVILNSLKESLAKRLKTSSVAMSVALATGLYATHTFVPPTPGPIAAAGNLGLESNLGLVIGVGVFVAAVAALAGMLWANRFQHVEPDGIEAEDEIQHDWQALKASYGKLPTASQAFAPIFVPILLICFGSIAKFPSLPLGEGFVFDVLTFLGQPLTALVIGLFLSVRLLKSDNKIEEFGERISQGITAAAPILLITGAGGAFGAVLKATPLGEYLGTTLSALGVGIFMPFIVAAALKSAQGSSTVALVTTSALVAPMLTQLGLDSEMGRVLTVMAIGAGAMTVSHANDSFFWVVSQFSRMSVGLAYRAQTMATLVQGVTAMALVYILSLVLL
ncbi:GntP family permease [Vibrio parahaemolyticus]|uniref:GntP family permease n=1 Tax=Vibrio parahaemolyticus TaxID=670 RepID=UPI00186A9CBC|nr:GntP family permease [Vibrio parahaemolyticus]EGR1754823.1 GntP family permease [Vibrio parahaemolyticus]ELB2092514.1 GntP family permease [Vibrio parahaemolyticus]ELB2095585.1 GntP family permease [Vibrio parahaemolyticus]ELB2124505.1 GntP family permease [Vibrio parahaemolyticus]ELB2127517.1 GntP family permease [Vibrio parahaemolyticus]